MQERLLRWASERGYRVAWGPVGVVEEARREIRERHARGEFDPEFFRVELEAQSGEVPLPGDGAVVVVAKPAPAHAVRFWLPGRAVEALIPPTYVRYRATFEDVRRELASSGLPGARVDHLDWPIKPIAARLGLVRYGRNNVTYVPGLGSYAQLCAFLTDAALPSAGGVPASPALLDECAGCSACVSACPTGAIDEERVLLRGERCVTHLNENPGPWPAWLPESAHNCLLGCLLCQQACPANGPLEVVATGLEFSEEETRALLGEGPKPGGHAETGIRFKLAWLGQPYSEPVLGRNLRALLTAGVRS